MNVGDTFDVHFGWRGTITILGVNRATKNVRIITKGHSPEYDTSGTVIDLVTVERWVAQGEITYTKETIVKAFIQDNL